MGTIVTKTLEWFQKYEGTDFVRVNYVVSVVDEETQALIVKSGIDVDVPESLILSASIMSGSTSGSSQEPLLEPLSNPLSSPDTGSVSIKKWTENDICYVLGINRKPPVSSSLAP